MSKDAKNKEIDIKNKKIELIAQTFANISAALGVTLFAGAALNAVFENKLNEANESSIFLLFLVYITLAFILLWSALKILNQWLN